MEDVADWNLLDLKHIIRVKNRFEVLCCQEWHLELVQAIVMRVSLVELFALDGLEHFKDGGLGVGGLFVEDVGHEFL